MKTWLTAITVLGLLAGEAGGEGPVRVSLLTPPPAAAQPAQQEGDDPAVGDPRIGEPVPLLVRIEAPAGLRLGNLEMVGGAGDFALTPAEGGDSLPLTSDGGVIDIPVVVVPFQVGDLEFPGVRLPWASADGNTGEAVSGAWPISVVATVDNAAEAAPADIRGPVDLPVPWPRWWLPAALALLAAVVALVWWLRRRPAPREVGVPVLPVDPFRGLAPDAWALRALERLLSEDILGRQGAGVHHERLSEIVRRYIEGRYGIDTFEHTSTEIIEALSNSSRGDPLARSLLVKVLEQSDLVKFARLEPAVGESHAIVGTARRYVEETRPAVAPQSDDATHTDDERRMESA